MKLSITTLVLLLSCTIGGEFVKGRVISGNDLRAAGRQLLEKSVTVDSTNSNFSLQWFSIRGGSAVDQCIVQGYPGGETSTEQGPLTVYVPQGVTSQIGVRISGGDYYQVNSQSQNPDLQVATGDGGQLTGLTFTANGGVGSFVTVTGGRISGYGAGTTCSFGVTFSVTSPANPQPSPPPPSQPPPPPTSVLPKNPCYCQDEANGSKVCFNFNQATSDINCAPPAGLNCQAGNAAAGAYTQQSGPVYFCS